MFLVYTFRKTERKAGVTYKENQLHAVLLVMGLNIDSATSFVVVSLLRECRLGSIHILIPTNVIPQHKATAHPRPHPVLLEFENPRD